MYIIPIVLQWVSTGYVGLYILMQLDNLNLCSVIVSSRQFVVCVPGSILPRPGHGLRSRYLYGVRVFSPDLQFIGVQCVYRLSCFKLFVPSPNKPRPSHCIGTVSPDHRIRWSRFTHHKCTMYIQTFVFFPGQSNFNLPYPTSPQPGKYLVVIFIDNH